MTRAEAIQIVGLKRGELGLPRGLPVIDAEQAIVEHSPNRSAAGPVEHRRAWIVQLASPFGFARVMVDDHVGEILHVERTV
jgi:hypothetical protein